MSSRDYRIQQQEAFVAQHLSTLRANPASSGYSDRQLVGRLRADYNGESRSSNSYVMSSDWSKLRGNKF
jgi:hypothetical protein